MVRRADVTVRSGAQGLTDGKDRGHERGSIPDTMGHELHRALICPDVSTMELGFSWGCVRNPGFQ